MVELEQLLAAREALTRQVAVILVHLDDLEAGIRARARKEKKVLKMRTLINHMHEIKGEKDGSDRNPRCLRQ